MKVEPVYNGILSARLVRLVIVLLIARSRDPKRGTGRKNSGTATSKLYSKITVNLMIIEPPYNGMFSPCLKDESKVSSNVDR